MVGGVPVLRQNADADGIHHRIDPGNDRIAIRHGQRAAGAEIILHVDDEKGIHDLSFRGVRAIIGRHPRLAQTGVSTYDAAMLTVAAFYHFAPLPEPAALQDVLRAVAQAGGVKGSILLAREGVNGTIAGDPAAVLAVLDQVRGWPGFEALAWKESPAAAMPFGRMKVKVKAEIVTMGQPDVDPTARVGHYVTPADWNALIADPDVAVIDTRNEYEVSLGTFAGAVDPGTRSFRDFPAWWAANGERFQGKRIAMFCTGGIRCEKSTNWLIGQGVRDVYHLQGGILKYLEEVPAEESLWQGECYVFDDRVSVGHGLVPGGRVSCGACRRPVIDPGSPAYEAGVCCAACVDEYGPEDRARFRERQRQMMLAAARGKQHLGAE